MIQCYTSQTQIKANIKELLVIKDAATKLKTNQEAIVSTSDSKNSAKAAGKHNREKRQKNSVSVTCSTYIEEVETVDKVFTQTNLIGTQATIVSQSTIIIKQTVQVCTVTQIVVIKANIQILVKVVIQINILIVQYQKVLKTLTKTTLTLESLNIVTVTLPPNLSVVDATPVPSPTPVPAPAPAPVQQD